MKRKMGKLLFFVIIAFFMATGLVYAQSPSGPNRLTITAASSGKRYYFQIEKTGKRGYYAENGIPVQRLFVSDNEMKIKKIVELSQVEKIVILDTNPELYNGIHPITNGKYISVKLDLRGDKNPLIGIISKFSLIPANGSDRITVTTSSWDGTSFLKSR